MALRRAAFGFAFVAVVVVGYFLAMSLYKAPGQPPFIWPQPYTCPPPLPPEQATLLRVVDGDTILVEVAGQIAEIRYIGMNTPEPWQAGYEEATQFNASLLQRGPLRLYRDRFNVDHLGRWLRYVFAGDVFVNEALVRFGWAEVFWTPFDTACQTRLRTAQNEARLSRRGLWAVGK